MGCSDGSEVGQLRQKIEERPSDPRFVLTEPGIGYRIAES
jgi:two-component system KDP operon response regulator KdpE